MTLKIVSVLALLACSCGGQLSGAEAPGQPATLGDGGEIQVLGGSADPGGPLSPCAAADCNDRDPRNDVVDPAPRGGDWASRH